MKITKKLLSLILVAVMIFGMFNFNSFAAIEDESGTPTVEFADMPDNWATDALNNAVTNGLLVGYNGKITPEGFTTRAQMAAVITRAFNATEKGDLSGYSDVSENSWYADNMAQAFQMGVMVGSNGEMHPEIFITRQEAFVILARAIKLAPSENMDKTFQDASEISDWAKGDIYAFVNNGYAQGNNEILDPRGLITRAQLAVLFDNLLKGYYKAEGEYTTAADGNIMVNEPGVTLSDLKVSGDIIIGDGVDNGEVTLNNVEVTGRMVVRGGGEHSINITGDSKLETIIVASKNSRVRINSKTQNEIGQVILDGNTDLIIEGKFLKFLIAPSEGTKVSVATDSTIKNILVNGHNSVINVAQGAVVETSVINGKGSSIEGKGSVGYVEANADNVKVTTPGTSVKAGEGTTGVTAGVAAVEAGETVTVKTIELSATTGDAIVIQGAEFEESQTTLLADFDAEGLNTVISIKKGEDAVNFSDIFESFELSTQVGEGPVNGPYNMTGDYDNFVYGPSTGFEVAANVAQITTTSGKLKEDAAVGVYTITTEVKMGESILVSSVFTFTVESSVVAPSIDVVGIPEQNITIEDIIEENEYGQIAEFSAEGGTPLAVSLIKGSEDYTNVRVIVEGLDDGIQLIAQDTSGNWYNIVKTGWGPSEGFALADATTNVYLVANTAGDYTAKIKLVDVSNDNAVLSSATASVTAE